MLYAALWLDRARLPHPALHLPEVHNGAAAQPVQSPDAAPPPANWSAEIYWRRPPFSISKDLFPMVTHPGSTFNKRPGCPASKQDTRRTDDAGRSDVDIETAASLWRGMDGQRGGAASASRVESTDGIGQSEAGPARKAGASAAMLPPLRINIARIFCSVSRSYEV